MFSHYISYFFKALNHLEISSCQPEFLNLVVVIDKKTFFHSFEQKGHHPVKDVFLSSNVESTTLFEMQAFHLTFYNWH